MKVQYPNGVYSPYGYIVIQFKFKMVYLSERKFVLCYVWTCPHGMNKFNVASALWECECIAKLLHGVNFFYLKHAISWQNMLETDENISIKAHFHGNDCL